jgi:hypothetical protein
MEVERVWMNPFLQATTAIDCDYPQIKEPCRVQGYPLNLILQAWEQEWVEQWKRSFPEWLYASFYLTSFKSFAI